VQGILLDDAFSHLNETRVAAIGRPETVDALAALVRGARERGAPVSVAGARHASGGQQLGPDAMHVDSTGLSRALGLDAGTGLVEAEAGITWAALHAWLRARDGHNEGGALGWGIRQKQSGADHLCLGGALAANAHGARPGQAPIVDDVESFTLVDAEGNVVRCSRTENAELFALAIGGYGLFGVIATVRLRLARRERVVRQVEIVDADAVEARLVQAAADGFLLGEGWLSTDVAGDRGLGRAVLVLRRPVEPDTPPTPDRKRPAPSDLLELARLEHVDPVAAFGARAAFAMATDGRVAWSDDEQFGEPGDDVHAALGRLLGREAGGSDVITEVFVPRGAFAGFLDHVRADFRRSRPALIRATVRTVAPETETRLPWAREPWTCVAFRLHVQRHAGAVGRAADDVRRVIDRALEASGTFYLAHHRWAVKEQLLAAYPALPAFLKAKRNADPHDVFVSEWYRHHRTMFAEEIA
jgi:FAD/FMN-containing dehydrogenase